MIVEIQREWDNLIALSQATALEIQIELIRRTQFNNFNGRQIVASLLAHRHLWEAVIFDRTEDLIKLRDLADNHWNVDTLWILAKDAAAAHEFVRIAEDEHWQADEVTTIADQQSVGNRLGSSSATQALVRAWWD